MDVSSQSRQAVQTGWIRLIPFQPDTKRIWGDHVTVYEHWTAGGEDGSSDVQPLKPVPPGKPVKTTISNPAAPCPRDKVNRQLRAARPNALWVSDFTYVATWQGFVYVAFVIDVFARRIVGWRVSRSAQTGFVLDALEQALHDRRPVRRDDLVHHSDRGSQGGFK